MELKKTKGPLTVPDTAAETEADKAALLSALQTEQKASKPTETQAPVTRQKAPPVEPIENTLDREVGAKIDATNEALRAATAQVAETKPVAIFISRFPKLTTHITVPGATELDRNQQPRAVVMPIQFKNGVYTTDNEHIITQLRVMALTNRQYFREETDERTAAVLLEAHRQQSLQRGGTSGTATSSDGNPQSAVAADAHMERLQTRAYNSNPGDPFV